MPIPYTQPGAYYDANPITLTQANAVAANAAAAAVSGVVALSSWLEPQWFIDPQNGNDNNDGLSAGQALQTWARLLVIWGTQSPILDIAVAVNYLSAPSVPADDPILFSGSGAGSLTINGFANTSNQVATGTITGFNARNRSGSPVIQNFAGYAGMAVGQLVLNANLQSRALVYSIAGGICTLSQPVTITGSPPNITSFLEDNGWTNGHQFVAYNLPVVHVLSVSFTKSTPATGGVFLYRLNLATAGSAVYLGDGVQLTECTTASTISASAQLVNGISLQSVGAAAFTGGNPLAKLVGLFAGYIGTLNAGAAIVDDDIILGNAFHSLNGSSFVRNVCIDAHSGQGLILTGGGDFDHRVGVLWGAGNITVLFAVLLYADPAVNAFTLVGGLVIGQLATAFAISISGGVGSLLGAGSGGRALSAAQLDTDIGSGGFHTSGVGALAVGTRMNGYITSTFL